MPAEIQDGCFLVARGVLNSSLWTMRAEDRIVAITCLALCNWKDKPWFDGEREIVIRRGQFIRSREHLATACQLSVQQIRTSVQHLENCGFLTRQSTKRYTVITVPKYDFYQNLANYSDSTNPDINQRLTRHQPDPNHKQEGEEGNKGKKEEKGNDHTPDFIRRVGDALGVSPGRNGAVSTPRDEAIRIVVRKLIDERGMPNLEQTIWMNVRAMFKRYGGNKVEAWASLASNDGKDVNEMRTELREKHGGKPDGPKGTDGVEFKGRKFY